MSSARAKAVRALRTLILSIAPAVGLAHLLAAAAQSQLREIRLPGSPARFDNLDGERDYGAGTRSQPNERGVNRQSEPIAIAPHLDSTGFDWLMPPKPPFALPR